MSESFTLSVPEMSCGHCCASITEVLSELGATGAFDMDARKVAVSGATAPETVVEALDDIGFSSSVVD